MHKLLRGVSVTFLLLAPAGPAFAIDQSAMEETNCLMACDANQEHCQSSGPASTRQNHSRAEYSSSRETKSSSAIKRVQPSKGR
jgi:hypothetical protein